MKMKEFTKHDLITDNDGDYYCETCKKKIVMPHFDDTAYKQAYHEISIEIPIDIIQAKRPHHCPIIAQYVPNLDQFEIESEHQFDIEHDRFSGSLKLFDLGTSERIVFAIRYCPFCGKEILPFEKKAGEELFE